MNPPGDGLGKTRKKQGRCRATLKKTGAGQGADVKTEIKTKEAPVVDKTGVRAKMVVGTTIEP